MRLLRRPPAPPTKGSRPRIRPAAARAMTMDSLLSRSLFALTVAAGLFALGLLLDVPLAVIDRLTTPRRV